MTEVKVIGSEMASPSAGAKLELPIRMTASNLSDAEARQTRSTLATNGDLNYSLKRVGTPQNGGIDIEVRRQLLHHS